MMEVEKQGDRDRRKEARSKGDRDRGIEACKGNSAALGAGLRLLRTQCSERS